MVCLIVVTREAGSLTTSTPGAFGDFSWRHSFLGIELVEAGGVETCDT